MENKRKRSLPFGGGIVAEVSKQANGFYWVGIKQTPKAHEALVRAEEALKLFSHNLTKEQAELLRDKTNEEYQKYPDIL